MFLEVTFHAGMNQSLLKKKHFSPFTYFYSIYCSRTSGGRLHLLPDIGKVPLADAVLIEDPSESSAATDDDGMASSTVQSPQHLLKPATTREPGLFRPFILTCLFSAPNAREKVPQSLAETGLYFISCPPTGGAVKF
jgi:hypothetical protein